MLTEYEDLFLAFTLLDPFYLCPQYTPVLQKSELRMFEVDSMEALCFYVLCAIVKIRFPPVQLI